MQVPDFKTLEEAKQFLRDNWTKGTSCPCCHQSVKLYKRAFPVASALTLIEMSKSPVDDEGYVFVPKVLEKLTSIASQGGYAVLSQHWNLIEQKDGMRDDGSKRVGYWRITELGKQVLKGKKIPKYALLFDGKSYGLTGKEITLKDALGSKFNYEELMAEVKL